MSMITQDKLKKYVEYNPETGLFFWIKTTSNRVRVGDLAAVTKNAVGYLRIGLEGKRHLAHRLAWLYIHGEFPPNQIDHINGIRTDNRLSNLRCVTNQQNCMNSSMRSHNTSGVNGISWNKKSQKWESYITINQKRRALGMYVDINEAILVRRTAEKALGFHQNHGKELK